MNSADAPRTLMVGAVIPLLFTLGGQSTSAEQTPAGESTMIAAPAETGDRDWPEYVGGAKCATCHPEEHERWQGSHHDLAMQEATPATVRGDFDNASFTHLGTTSTFQTRDGKFFVRTDGPDGKLRDYEIKYTFGVDPLQQYLIEFPGGRLQTLSLCWDTRPKATGGQRWFHLYPDEPVRHDHALHWTKLSQNWNYMCAECHSTNLQRNYDLRTNSFDTKWAEIDVSCEACHGPGSKHLAWVMTTTSGETKPYASKGLVVQLRDPGSATFTIDLKTGNAKRERPFTTWKQIETCAPCHSRRSTMHSEFRQGSMLLDAYRLRLLDEAYYYGDGQIQEEVYVYGSFRQSTMYHEGVTCSDCHDPHSLKTYGTPDETCSKCHAPEVFAREEHHHHAPRSTGASCVACHMPETTYMIVDPRRDHSLRVPRPDLSVKLGTPNVCNGCHTNESKAWAVGAFRKWYPAYNTPQPHYGEILTMGRERSPGYEAALAVLIGDAAQPSIVRATGLSLLNRISNRSTFSAVQQSVSDADPLVRHAAASALELLGPGDRAVVGFALLNDPIRGVRVEATRVLSPIPRNQLSTAQRDALEKAAPEFIAATLANAEHPSSHVNLAMFLAQRGLIGEAVSAYKTAQRLDSSYVPAYVNLADMFRAQGRDDLCEKVLRDAIPFVPDDATVRHTLGLVLIRQGRTSDAIGPLATAVRLGPETVRFRYVHAVALHSIGRIPEALVELKTAHGKQPYDLDVLVALVTMHRDNGSVDDAIGYARKLVEVAPDDVGFGQLLLQVEALKRKK